MIWTQRQQESCAIAKMTARCALHMSALKVFETPEVVGGVEGTIRKSVGDFL